jgi:hypothetical protein
MILASAQTAVSCRGKKKESMNVMHALVSAVDDDESVRSLCQSFLGRSGWKVGRFLPLKNSSSHPAWCEPIVSSSMLRVDDMSSLGDLIRKQSQFRFFALFLGMQSLPIDDLGASRPG